MNEKASTRSTVFVIDDDASVRDSLKMLFEAADLEVKLFGNARDFVRRKPPAVPSCLILDVRLPDLSGLDFQSELAAANILIPIIFISGHGDIPMTVKAMKAGAVAFLTKPIRSQDILDSVRVGLERDRERLEKDAALANLRACYETLTPRERQMVAFATSGLLNKQIAGALGLSEITVRMRRGSLARKMGAKSVADLVRMADALGIERIKR